MDTPVEGQPGRISLVDSTCSWQQSRVNLLETLPWPDGGALAPRTSNAQLSGKRASMGAAAMTMGDVACPSSRGQDHAGMQAWPTGVAMTIQLLMTSLNGV